MSQLSRRSFLRGAGLAGAGVIVGSELRSVERGYTADFAGNPYQFLFEQHGQKLTETIHQKATGIFVEFNLVGSNPDGTPKTIYTVPDNELLSEVIKAKDKKLMAAVMEQQLPIALGDVAILELEEERRFRDERRRQYPEEDREEFKQAILLLFLSQTPALAEKIYGRLNPDENPKLFDRRQALRVIAKLLATGGVAVGLHQASGTKLWHDLLVAKEINTPQEKLLLRFYGPGTLFDPEDLARNVIFAIKTVMFRQWQEKSGIKPFIAANLGKEHEVVQDLISLPLEFLEQLVQLTSEGYLKKAGLTFGEDIGTVRVLLPDEQGKVTSVLLINRKLAAYGKSKHGEPQDLENVPSIQINTIARPGKK